jgi:hypothetical protein
VLRQNEARLIADIEREVARSAALDKQLKQADKMLTSFTSKLAG